ncbi:hypothetical protein LG943_17620 [Streptomonospora sp. S1-112]|uniref:Uncharacterized protein n=1 Tax=Streptomonospora mangrovi TaxID=2883123 RepID=A0A9X3NLU1_9ACTN|nr:hypothetical protein [Streptomonospora mangrovi]MDA0566119.1 hypothetical protein [Streptomonospora mangrovi]
MLRAARSFLAMRDPLDVEVGVSKMLGSWWGRRMPGVDVDRLFGEGLVAHAADSGTPAGLALLTGIAVLGTSVHQRELAEKGAAALVERGTNRPVWADALGRARPVAAYTSGNRFGDTDDVICVFRYGPEEAPGDPATGSGAEHALIAVIDHNSGGVLRDCWVSTKVDRLLAHCRAQAEGGDPMAVFSTIRLERARALLDSALRSTDRALAGGTGMSVADSSLAAHNALLRSRLRSLPRDPRDQVRPGRSRDRRAMLAARFLASDAAADLSDSFAASRCVDHIIAYGCDVDGDRPLRVSPRKVEAFLLRWLPRRVILLPEEHEAMPHVLAAWIRWAGPRHGLPEVAVDATLDALWEATAAFTTSYPDMASSFGLRQEVVRRLIPDGDLAALPRRMFAFPLLAGDLLEESAEEFDPATREGRRALLRLDHFGEYDAPVKHKGKHSTHHADALAAADPAATEEALDAHERLAERLWKGDPPALWSAAERLLDRGQSRPAVLRTLMGVVEDAEGEDDVAARLEEL